MRFLYPLGLLGLIGVPILIIIYIIKNKYTEQTVSSTYLWKLSEKFLKRKKRPPKIAGLLSLILQIVAVVAISFAIAHPVLIFPDAADEYCIIVDASGSMNIRQNGKTRFELGKGRVRDIIEESADGSVYTLIYANGDSTTVACERTEEKSYALQILNEFTPSYGFVELADALELAQNYFGENNAVRTYLVTDKKYASHENVELIDVSGDATNFAVVSVNAPQINETGDAYTVTVTVASYEDDAELNVSLYVDGASEPLSTETVAVSAGDEDKKVVFALETGAFTSLKAVISNADALSADNEYVLYNAKSENSYKTLLVSDSPLFLQSAVEAVSGAAVETMDAVQYADALAAKGGEAVDGYGLYIFDSIHPGVLPDDGTVWLFNQTANVDGAEFSVRRQSSAEVVQMEMTKDSVQLATQLTENIGGKDMYVYTYMKYGVSRNATVLFSSPDGDPMIFTCNNVYGNREVVFAFSLHDSNLSMLGDFVILVKNLLDYSFPDVLETVTYDCGENLELNVPPACSAIKITAPDGKESYPASNVEANEYVLSKPGVYTVTLTVADEEREYHAFAGIPQEERKVSTTESDFNLQGEAGEGGLDGKYDDLLVIFILLGVVVLIDWVVYCYDKYQLR